MHSIDQKMLLERIENYSRKKDYFNTFRLIQEYIDKEQKYLIEKYVKGTFNVKFDHKTV